MIAMPSGLIRSELYGFVKVVLVAALFSGCSERKPAGPPEGTNNTATQPASAASTEPPAEDK